MQAQIQDMKFRKWVSADKSEIRVYVEWLHVVGLKNPRWETMGYINGKMRAFVNQHGNIEGMLGERGITLAQIGQELK